MAVTHQLVTRQLICNTVVDLLDGGVLRFLTAADVTGADGSFGTPAFGAADASAIATANAIGDATNAGSSAVVAKGAMRSTTADVVLFSVTTIGGGGDYELSNTTVANGEAIVTSSLTYAAPA